VATAKHYIGNEQEIMRQTLEGQAFGYNISEAISSNIDDRTMHELYLWPFAESVRAGVGGEFLKMKLWAACADWV
jgi:beta-glucosidase